MKFFVFLSLLFMGSVSFADVSLQDCQRLNFSSEQNECAKIIKGAYYSNGVARICFNMNFGSETLSCLRATKDVSLSNDALQFCGEKLFASDTIKCLKDQAMPANPGLNAETKLRIIEGLANQAVIYLESGRLLSALDAVLEILDLARTR